MRLLAACAGGDQARKDAWLDEVEHEWRRTRPYAERIRLDGESEGMLAQATARSLFASDRLVRVSVGDGVPAEALAALCRAADENLAVLLDVRAPRAAAAKKTVLAHEGQWQSFALPERAGASQRVSWAAQRHGVSLDAKSRALLAGCAQADVSAVDSALRACALVGLERPTAQQLEQLLGSVRAPDFPFELVDLLRNGNLPGALELSRRLEPASVSALLAKHFATAAALAEGPDTQWCKDAAVSDWAAGQAASSAQRWGLDGVLERWAASAAAMPACRTGSWVALARLLCQLM